MTRSPAPLPVHCLAPDQLQQAPLSGPQKHWLEANGFTGQTGRLLALPDEKGRIAGFAFGLGEAEERPPLLLGSAAAALSPGNYRLVFQAEPDPLAFLAFRLGAYRFDRYRAAGRETVELAGSADDEPATTRLVEGAFLARDLINTPANDLGPEGFETRIRAIAENLGMDCKVIAGDDLLAHDLPMIHAVGRAGSAAPRLVELTWGEKNHPSLCLVGKGVTFDTGGLNIKPGRSMALMKKDMGGAANILGLAHVIVSARLKVRLRVLVPVVENAISATAFRPGDILPSRGGLHVEIGNTDAEGRLILADALALASESAPDLLIDMATLTGAARVALGPELPPVYSPRDDLATDLVARGMALGDPLWHMPLWSPYAANLNSPVADINHITSDGFAGSITAALFLQRFVGNTDSWLHLDIFGWAPKARPGYPEGGADQGIRALFALLEERYGTR